MPGVCEVNWPAPECVEAFYTTRQGGSSQGPYHSLNLGMHVGDKSQHVLQNRRLLPQHAKIQWLNQVHGTQCISLDGLDFNTPTADASTTKQANLVCAVMTADCLPVLLCDVLGTRVAAVHAGWRGLVSGVIQAALAHFPQRENVIAWLGPAISQPHFEVGQDVVDALPAPLFDAVSASEHQENKFHFDLAGAAKRVLHSERVPAVYGGDLCTYAQPELFYSHRRSTHLNEQATGRMVCGIFLK